MEQKNKVTEEKLYKVIRKMGNHQNTKLNDDGSKAALQFTENNNMDGPLDIIEVTDDEVIRRGKELSGEVRTWKGIILEDIIIPVSKDAIDKLLKIGYQYFEVWLEEKAVPTAKEKSKMVIQNAENVFSGVNAALRGEEPKALRLIRESKKLQEKEPLAPAWNSIPEHEVDENSPEKILMSVQEIEEISSLAKHSAETLVGCINLLRNTAVSDTALPEDQMLKLQTQLESLTTTDVFKEIDLLLEDKNKGILDAMSLQILKAFRQENFLINGKAVPIKNYIKY